MVRKIATFKMTSHSKLAMVFFVLLTLVAPAISAPIDFPAYVIPGSNWYVGTSAPTSSIGSSGDFYLQNSTGMIYQKIIGTWTAQGVLSSPTGTAINESYAYLPGRAGGQTLYGGNAANDDLVLEGTSSGTKTTSYVIIQPTTGSKVGIGTSSPIESLHVNGNITIANGDRYKSLDSRGVGRNTLRISGDSFIYGDLSSSSSSDTYLEAVRNLYLWTGSSQRITITSAGNMGIKAPAPTSTLHVNGNIRVTGCASGTVTADSGGNFTCISDEKLKTNIRRILPSGTTNIQKIENLSPTCYHFSSSSGLDTQNEYCGFLAGEVKKIIPEAVKTKQDVKYEQKLKTKGKTLEEDEYETVEIPTGTTTDSLDDRAIIITLVNAVKEQQAEIEQLQAKVARLEGKKVDKTV